MPKKSCGRKKGIQRGIPRHRVGGNDVRDGREVENTQTEDSQFFGISRANLSSFAEKVFNLTLVYCGKFHLIGFKRLANGQLVLLSQKDQIWHYATIICCLALSLQKTWGAVEMFLYEELRVQSFLCLTVALGYNVSLIIGMGIVMKPKETIDLHNSWTQISASLKAIDPGSKCSPFENQSVSLKIILGSLNSQGAGYAMALMSVITSDVPTFLFPTIDRIGLLPTGALPNWVWRLLFAPLEWLMQMLLVLIASFSIYFFVIQIGLLDVYLRQLGKLNVSCMKSRRQLEQMYVQLELFHRIGQAWIRFYFPSWLVALSTSTIVTAFVTIRYTQLPLTLYMLFPYATIGSIIVLFWQNYDVLRIVRASEDILGGLWKHEAPYFRGMTRAKRIETMKRSKAMRPLGFLVADSEFSVNVPIGAWDEIVNQILFLLSF